MPEEQVTFTSEGRKLIGNIRVPDDARFTDRRPAFIVLHGFGSTRHAGNVKGPCEILDKLGYATMRFDMPGCGDSEGERGRLICLEQVQATSDALTTLAEHAGIDGARIAVAGSSFGAAVAVYTGGVDKRVAAVISSGGWGDGERKFRGQHTTPEAWAKFTKMLEAGRHNRSLMVPRYDIVPIPQHLRGHLAANSVQAFAWETVRSMYDFRADDVVAGMKGRPLLLLHSSVDSVTPTEQSIEMFKRAEQPTDLHLFAETDHFMFAESNTRVRTVLLDWLEKYFPGKAAKEVAA